MWKIKIKSMTERSPMPSDTLDLKVEFFDETGRSILKIYPVYLDELTTISLATVKALIQGDLDRLTKMDTLKALIATKIDKEI